LAFFQIERVQALLRAADFDRAFEIGLRLCRNALQTNISTTRSADPILLVLRWTA
jgi:hypothetical protein